MASETPPAACTGGAPQGGSAPGLPSTQTVDPGGTVAAQSVPTSTAVPSSSDGPLAFTGMSISEPILLAFASIGLGVLLVVSTRRRLKTPPGSGLGFVGVALISLAVLHGAGRVATDSSCLPPTALPESPLTALLPVAGVAVLSTVVLLNRLRNSSHDK